MWIEIKTDDFVNALKGLKPKTNSPNKLMNLEAQISYENSEALIVINGGLTKCPAKGKWQGFVCLKFGYLVPFIKIKPTSEIVKIEFEEEKIKIDSAKFSATWIKTSQWVTTQLADAQLFNLVADEIQYCYCSKCGKKKAINLKDIQIKTRPSVKDKILIKLYETTKATHGCTDCGHGWIEIQ